MAAGASGDAGRPLILIVENEAPLRELLRLTLLPLEVDTLEARNLGEAIEHLRAGPDLVILDFYLEPEAGTDLLEHVAPKIPILLLTASVETKNLRNKYPRIDAVLSKPTEQREVRAAVRQLLGIPEGP